MFLASRRSVAQLSEMMATIFENYFPNRPEAYPIASSALLRSNRLRSLAAKSTKDGNSVQVHCSEDRKQTLQHSMYRSKTIRQTLART